MEMIFGFVGETINAYIGEDPLQRVYGYASRILAMLRKRGIPDPGASFATYQTYFETGAYNNNGIKNYNNASGIMYAGQKNAHKGPNGYAIFDTLEDWANAFKHEITKKSNPSAAKTIEDYNNRLIANKYYTANPGQYLDGLKRARYVLKSIPATMRAGTDNTGQWQAKQDMDIPGSQQYVNTPGSANFEASMADPANWPKWAKYGAGAVGVLVLLKVLTK